VVAPLGGDEALLLERAQQAVEIADVDPTLHPELREPVEQLVAVERPLAQEQQQRRLDEALDAGVDVPAPRLDESRGAPLLTMTRTAWDETGRAVEYGSHLYRASRYSFELTLTI